MNVASASQSSPGHVSKAAMLAAFQSDAIVALSLPLHSKVSSITPVQIVKSGGVVSSRVSVAVKVLEFPVASVKV